MFIDEIQESIIVFFRRYRLYFFVFLVTLFIGLTFTHPTVLLDDEWITTNQLSQLHAGHQVIINEGKYGLFENGTMSNYFFMRSNILGYSLFLPIISLPTFWIIDIFSEHFVFLILYLWTILSLTIILFIHYSFQKYSFIGKWQWTQIMIIVIFGIFLINLYFYSSFPVNGSDNFPEVLSIVFTNLIMLAFAGTLIFEINLTIFKDNIYSFFGTLVCLFSSSYFFWATACKDHVLVLLLFVAVVLCLVKFFETQETWYIPLAFIISGLLAWARPELALAVFILISGICLFTIFRIYTHKISISEHILVLVSPLFVVIGALPFFLNNHLITKNILIPTTMTYFASNSTTLVVNTSKSLLRESGDSSLQSVINFIIPSGSLQPIKFLSDISGISFYPFNGSIGVVTLTPVFLLALCLIGFSFFTKKMHFSSREKQILILIMLLCLTVILAYFNRINSMNTSLGIRPDIRYLSPVYFPLSLFGLIILKKENFIVNDPIAILRKMIIFCILAIPVSLIILSIVYSDSYVVAETIYPLNTFFFLAIFVLVAINLVVIVNFYYTKTGEEISKFFIPILLSMPLLWQINSIYYTSVFSVGAGYTFWIPIVREIFLNGIYHFLG